MRICSICLILSSFNFIFAQDLVDRTITVLSDSLIVYDHQNEYDLRCEKTQMIVDYNREINNEITVFNEIKVFDGEYLNDKFIFLDSSEPSFQVRSSNFIFWTLGCTSNVIGLTSSTTTKQISLKMNCVFIEDDITYEAFVGGNEFLSNNIYIRENYYEEEAIYHSELINSISIIQKNCPILPKVIGPISEKPGGGV
ncbi:hypothetical protein N9N67_00250 [Bacteriovoracaceae bacterium]|nr:hypothetical protein [Bacteriovoracaceae bacterium]